MKYISNTIFNEGYFKVVLVVILLCTTNHYTMVVYSSLIYFVLLWGVIICVKSWKYDKSTLYSSKINVLLLLFLVLNCLTVILNYKNELIKNIAVLITTAIYFHLYFVNKKQNTDEKKRQMTVISWICFVWTLIQGVIQIMLFICKIRIPIKINETITYLGYNVRGGNLIQLSGIADNLTTVGALAVISIIISIYLIFIQGDSKWLKCILVTNIGIQIFTIVWSNNLTSLLTIIVVSMGIAIFLTYRNCYKRYDNLSKALILAIVVMLLIGVSTFIGCKLIEQIPISFYSSEDITEKNIDNKNDNIDSDKEVKSNRNITDSLSGGSGRYQIWNKAIELWKEKPILGHGYKNSIVTIDDGRTYGHMHNVFIQVLVGNGVISFIIIIIVIFYHVVQIAKNLLKKPNYSNEFIINSIMVMALLFFNMLNSNIVFERTIMAVLFWNSLGYICVEDSEE